MPGDEAADLAVLACLRDPLDPEVRHQGLLPACDRGQAFPARRRSTWAARTPSSDRAVLIPRGVEAREPEVALRREVAVQHGLGDARLAGDLGGRRPRVAALREDAQRRLDDLPAASVGGQAACAAHSASAGTACGLGLARRIVGPDQPGGDDGADQGDGAGDEQRIARSPAMNDSTGSAAGQLGGHDRPHQRDPDRAAHLTAGVEDGRADARPWRPAPSGSRRPRSASSSSTCRSRRGRAPAGGSRRSSRR